MVGARSTSVDRKIPTTDQSARGTPVDGVGTESCASGVRRRPQNQLLNSSSKATTKCSLDWHQRLDLAWGASSGDRRT
uniref:Uncharacterized protein n=1 Tax=Cannabis sativa TaxID=3483 RepID=A0A803QFE1_CANSA